MSNFRTVSELEPYKEICHINVQIIRLWKNYIASDRYTIELVLCDAFGDRIHASIGGALVAPYERRLKEGLWTTFENFTVVHSGGPYRTSKHTYMIEFVHYTRVCVSDFLPRPLTGFQPVAFRDILDGLVNTEYLVDVIGQIVGVSNVEIVSLNGKDTEKISLELQNEDSDHLTVHLWGKHAIFVHKATKNLSHDKYIICVLRFCKISVFKESVSTAFGVTDVMLNPEMLEVEDFSKLMNKRDPQIALVASKPYFLTPDCEEYKYLEVIIQKSILEVLETNQRQRCIVMCTIAGIDYDMGWYYMSCKSCLEKVVLLPSDKNVYGNQKSPMKKKYYCLKCKNYQPELMPRYGIQLVVLDNIGHTQLLLSDNLAEDVLGISCIELSGSSTNQIEEPAVVHSVLSTLIGGTYFCKIGIEEENFLFNFKTFKVLEIVPITEF